MLDLFGKAGTDIAPTGAALTVTENTSDVAAGATAGDRRSQDRARTIRALVLRAPKAQALALAHAKLRVTWDDAAMPSIDVPLALFFGAGTLYNRNPADEYLVKGLFASVHFDATDVQLAAYLPMPFFHHAHIELVAAEAIPGLRWHVRTEPYTGPTNHVGYFHATYVDHGTPVAGQGSGRARHHQDRRRRAVLRELRRHVLDLLGQRAARHARGRSALLLRRQRDPAGAGHGHRRVGRRRRLLGRADHDAALRRAPHRRARSRLGERTPKTRSSRPTASCSPT